MGCSKPEAGLLWAFTQYASHVQPGKEDAVLIHHRTKQLGADNVRNLFTNNLAFWQQLVDGTYTSYAENHFCRQEENQGSKFIVFLIHLLTLPTRTVLLFAPDLVRFSKQCILYGLQRASGVTDCRWVQALSKSVRSKPPFQASKQDPPFLDPVGTGLAGNVPENTNTGVTKGDLWAAESWPRTSYCRGAGEGTALEWTFPSYCLIKIFSTLFRI